MLRFTSAPGFSTGGQTITFLMRMVPALYRIMLTYLSGGDFAALSLVNKEHAYVGCCSADKQTHIA